MQARRRPPQGRPDRPRHRRPCPAAPARTCGSPCSPPASKAAEAKEAGADIVGADDLVERVEGGFLDFDVAIATPDLMGQIGKVARILGPRKLMPNPKTGTVTTDVGKAVAEFKGGRVEYRTDKAGNIHVPVGKVTFDRKALMANIRAVLDEVAAGQAGVGQGQVRPGRHHRIDHGPRRQGRPQPHQDHRRRGGGRLPVSCSLTTDRPVDIRCARVGARKGPVARPTRRHMHGQPEAGEGRRRRPR